MALEIHSPYQRLHYCENANYSSRNFQAMIYIMFLFRRDRPFLPAYR